MLRFAQHDETLRANIPFVRSSKYYLSAAKCYNYKLLAIRRQEKQKTSSPFFAITDGIILIQHFVNLATIPERDCFVVEFTLSVAEGLLAMT